MSLLSGFDLTTALDAIPFGGEALGLLDGLLGGAISDVFGGRPPYPDQQIFYMYAGGASVLQCVQLAVNGEWDGEKMKAVRQQMGFTTKVRGYDPEAGRTESWQDCVGINLYRAMVRGIVRKPAGDYPTRCAVKEAAGGIRSSGITDLGGKLDAVETMLAAGDPDAFDIADDIQRAMGFYPCDTGELRNALRSTSNPAPGPGTPVPSPPIRTAPPVGSSQPDPQQDRQSGAPGLLSALPEIPAWVAYAGLALAAVAILVRR